MRVPTRDAVVGVDLGGTTVKGVLVEVDGTARDALTLPCPPRGGAAALDALVDCVRLLVVRAGRVGLQVVGIGVLTPGVLDEVRGRVVYASNLDWHDVDVAGRLRAGFDVPVALGHDVRGASVAERAVGGARGVDDFVLLTLGTGIACAIHTEGRLRLGAQGSAGEVGHIPVLPDGETCRCGQRGCLEAYASASSIARRYTSAGGRAGVDAAWIAGRLGGDQIADTVWAEATHALALALATLTLLLDPALVLLGGGLSGAGAALLAPTVAGLHDVLAWREPPEIRISPLGMAAGRIGGAVLALQAADLSTRLAGWTAAGLALPTAPRGGG